MEAKMKKEDRQDVERIRLGFARAKISRIVNKRESNPIFSNDELFEECAKILMEEMYAPHLGCATTGELIDEIKARAELSGDLQYRPIDGEDPDPPVTPVYIGPINDDQYERTKESE